MKRNYVYFLFTCLLTFVVSGCDTDIDCLLYTSLTDGEYRFLNGGAWTGYFEMDENHAEPRGYLAGTQTPDGQSTGIDHLKELGVTHIHILPSFDFSTIDETSLEENSYNWGYDPKNYNAVSYTHLSPFSSTNRLSFLKVVG